MGIGLLAHTAEQHHHMHGPVLMDERVRERVIVTHIDTTGHIAKMACGCRERAYDKAEEHYYCQL